MATLKPHHAALLGGGTGVGLAALIVGLLQQATHHPLASIDVQTIYGLVTVAGAYLGAMLPTLQRDLPAGLVSKESLDNAESIAAALRDEVTELRAHSTVGGYVSGSTPTSQLATPPASVTTPAPPTS